VALIIVAFAFASGGGAQFDKDGDRFLSKKEMQYLVKIEGKELDQNFCVKKLGTGLGGLHHLALVKIQRVLPNGLKNFLFLADLLSEN
jgi:hypothetical protein